LPLSFWGGTLAHFGVGMALLGLAATGFGSEVIASVKQGQTLNVGPYQVTYERSYIQPGPNYQEMAAEMKVTRDGALVTTVTPARRNFGARKMATTQAGIATLWLGQLYLSINDLGPDGSLPVRFYWKPLVTLIWLGAVAMALGGALSLADRRLRIGAPVRAKAPRAAAPA
jgi:cytochrome c-type biogenesis protein CcmF